MQTVVLSLIYIAGAVLSFLMSRTEIAAENEPYTIGNRLLIIALSLLSFAFVLIILINAWVKLIRLTGYWDKSVEKPLTNLPGVDNSKVIRSKPNMIKENSYQKSHTN